MTLSDVSLGDIQIRVRDEGQGPTVLMVHGFPLDHTMWHAQFPAHAEPYRLVAPDLRGFGGSTVTAGIVTMEQYADDLAKLIDVLQMNGPVVFCGLSMGGYIAWQFALKYPEKLHALILCDTKAAADTAEAATGRRVMAERVLTDGPEFLAESMLPKLLCDQTREKNPKAVEDLRKTIVNAPRAGIAAALRGMADRPDVTDRLADIRVPALLICGSEDVITPAKEMKTIAEKLPHGRYVEIPNAGHMSPLEQPDAVNEAMREFLAGL